MKLVQILLCIFFLGEIYSQVAIRVTDGSEGLPFVDVYNSNQGLFYATDTDGYFVLPDEVVDSIQLSFFYTGYEEKTISVGALRDHKMVVLSKGLFLDEIVLVGRTDERTQDIINQVETIAAIDIRKTSPQTSADALGQHAGVFIQKSQMGGGSPIIRGFEANKVLLVVDGVRMNNAIYRGGHLQNAITIDAAILDRMEVIYGPGSLVYGSDALGGVVHFRSKMPQLDLTGNPVSGQAYVRYASANREKTVHADINLGGSKWATLSSATISDFGDLRTGSRRGSEFPEFGKRTGFVDRINGRDTVVQNENVNVQIGTAYKQYDLLQKFLYQPASDLKFIVNLQHSTSSNVPRYDALTELDTDGQLRFADWYYGPQDRWLASARVDYTSATMLFDKLIAISSYQHIDEDRIDRKYKSDRRDIMEEDVDVFSLTADFRKYLSPTWELEYGVELTANRVRSTAFSENIVSNEIRKLGITRYPSGGSSTSNIAAYLFTKKEFDRVRLLAGIRYNNQQANVQYLRSDDIPWPEAFYDGLDSDNTSTSWSIGGGYDLGRNWRVKSQLATAYRSPNIDDLAKIRINNNEVSVPNLELAAETAITGEMTLSKTVGKSYMSATVFQTNLSNAIVRADFSLADGTSILVDEGDTLQVVSNVNAERARVWGASLNINYALNNNWKFVGSTSLVKGRQESIDGQQSPLAHIPPLYGNLTAAYEKGNHDLQLVIRYNGKKPIGEYGGSEDNPENATPEGTPAWHTWNIYYNYQINQYARLSISLENVLDQHYRGFASGVSAAGRNIGVTVGLDF